MHRASDAQRRKLLELLEEGDLFDCRKTADTYKHHIWQNIAWQLNAIQGGVLQDNQAWHETWIEWKNTTKEKVSLILSRRCSTSLPVKLTTLELKLLRVINFPSGIDKLPIEKFLTGNDSLKDCFTAETRTFSSANADMPSNSNQVSDYVSEHNEHDHFEDSNETTSREKTCEAQRRKLLELLSEAGLLVDGKENYNAIKYNKHYFWENVAVQLNEIAGGTCKNPLKWCKMWIDWKNNTKKKIRLLMERRSSGLSSSIPVKLTVLELKLLKMINYPPGIDKLLRKKDYFIVDTGISSSKKRGTDDAPEDNVHSEFERVEVPDFNEPQQDASGEFNTNSIKIEGNDDISMIHRYKNCLAQKRKLLELLGAEGVLVDGKVQYTGTNKQNFWENIAVQLNAMDSGVHKNTTQWCKMWSDWKSNTKKKVKLLLRSGVSYASLPDKFTALEFELLKMIDYPTGINKLPSKKVGVDTELSHDYFMVDNSEQVSGDLWEDNGNDIEFLNVEVPHLSEIPAPSRVVISHAQKRKLLKLLHQEGIEVDGKEDYSVTKYNKEYIWENIAVQLNAIENGAHKNSKSWRQMWADWKSKTKKKVDQLLKSGTTIESLPSKLNGLSLELLKTINYPSGIDKLKNEHTGLYLAKHSLTENDSTLTRGVVDDFISEQVVDDKTENNDNNDDHFEHVEATDLKEMKSSTQESVINAQKRKLLEIFSEAGVIVDGKMQYNVMKYNPQLFWKNVAAQLNAVKGGPHRSTWKWCKMWNDWRSNTKRKVKLLLKRRSSGWSSSRRIKLTSLELKLLRMINYPPGIDKRLNKKIHVDKDSSEIPSSHEQISDDISDSDNDRDLLKHMGVTDLKELRIREKACDAQRRKLLDLLKEGAVLVDGKVQYDVIKYNKQYFWENIALQLNTIEGGINKNARKWCQMWADWKNNTRRKVKQLFKYGVSLASLPDKMTDIELELLKMINYPPGVDKLAVIKICENKDDFTEDNRIPYIIVDSSIPANNEQAWNDDISQDNDNWDNVEQFEECSPLKKKKKISCEDYQTKTNVSEDLRLRALEIKLKERELKLQERQIDQITKLANLEKEKLKYLRDISASLTELIHQKK